jgi:Superfamily II helicase and inactivated derivatives
MKEMIEIINHVKTDHLMIKSYISGGIDNGRNIMLVYLNSKSPLKIPNWFGYKATDYNAQKIKDEILAEFDSKRGAYGYGILLGKQPDGSFIICIDIDIDNDCKDSALKQFEEIFKKHNIHYYLETTKSGRYHIYVALDKITEELKTITKLNLNCDAIKYKYGGKPVKGEIELLGANRPHMSTVYNGIINNKKPFFVEQLIINSAEDFLEALKEFLGINEELNEIDYADDTDEFEETEETEEIEDQNLDIGEIYKLIDFFKLVRKYNYLDGWEIEKTLSAICITQEMDGYLIHRTFEDVYGEDYDEDRTDYIVDLTREKDPQRLPTIASVIYHAKEFLRSGLLTDEEKKFVEDLIKTLRRQSIGDFELPEYLINAEKVYFIASYEKRTKDKLTYYRERWFIERNVNNVKQVWHVEIETSHPKDIYKRHRSVSYPKFVSIKTDIKRLLKEKTEVYEFIINDEFTYRPPFSFDRLEDIAIAIAKQCSRYKQRFDIQLFQEYLDIKIMEYLNKHNGKPVPCLISKNTGWNEDFTMFFHYDLNDEQHELSKDNPLYKNNKAESSKDYRLEEQHELVLSLLKEGKLLGVLLAVSTASILLKPFELQPLTCILAGNPGAGKTIAALTATSLFYKSDNILITASTTTTGIELMLSALNSLPFVIDEGALADDAATVLKNLIFSVAASKGKTRGKRDLSVETKDIISNVFWTTETTDIDGIRRSGAFRRMLYIVVESWEQFTSLFDVKTYKPNRYYSGCGVDYIRYAIRNLDTLRYVFWYQTNDFGEKYSELAGLAGTVYAGIIFLEKYYSQKFTALRQTVDALLESAKRMFIASKDDILFAFQQYLYRNLHRFGQVDVEYVEDGQPRRKADGTPVYRVVYRPHVEALGEYDKFTQTFYITSEGIKTIARELEKERSILESALNRAGVMSKTDNAKYSQVLGRNMRFYVVRFNDLPSNTDTDTDIEF